MLQVASIPSIVLLCLLLDVALPPGPQLRVFLFFSVSRDPRDLHSFPTRRSSDLRDIGRMVLAAEGRKANDSHADCYQYFCVPEYGTANGRLHFHAVHFMRTLPTGSVDPNFGRRVRNRRQLNSLQNTWPYGY